MTSSVARTVSFDEWTRPDRRGFSRAPASMRWSAVPW